jgi:D-amino-acid dehydrogenase
VSADVIVVGGGAIGVSAAYELARAGCAVTLLERAETLAAECSAGNTGIISPGHSTPLANPDALRDALRSLIGRDVSLSLRPRLDTLGWLARFASSSRAERAEHGRQALEAISRASLELHAELGALGTTFERRGLLYLCETADARDRVHRSLGGDTSRALSASAARTLEPALGTGIAGGVFHPDEAYVNPVRFVAATGEAASAAGARLRTGVRVRSLRRRGGSLLVETSAGEFGTERAVLAAGAWSKALARSLGVFIPLIAGKGHHVDFAPGPGDPRMPILLDEARLAVAPFEDRIRIAGRVELTGLDPSISTREIGAIHAAASRLLPALAGRTVLETWAGLRPCTPDGLPIIGRPAAAPELVIATGHAMKGVALAPVTARLVAELVTGEPPSHELAAFSPDRFRPLLRRP